MDMVSAGSTSDKTGFPMVLRETEWNQPIPVLLVASPMLHDVARNATSLDTVMQSVRRKIGVYTRCCVNR